MPEIGATLREARMRAHIDVSEIEAKTKIRAKYLRALENEEWDLLPGPTYVRSFLRTYAQALGLDSKLLLEEHRLRHERPSEADLQPIVPAGRMSRGGGRRVKPPDGRWFPLAVGAIVVVIALLLIGLLSGGASNKKPPSAASHAATGQRHKATHRAAATPVVAHGPKVLSLQIRPTAPVYVCLLSATGRKLIPGLTLRPGATPQTYRSHRFLLTLGNNSLTLVIDGRVRIVPASSAAIGYSITAAGRKTLAAGKLPTCA